jgi:hypothetical protein
MRLVVWLWVRLMRVLGMEESGEVLTENPGKAGDVIPLRTRRKERGVVGMRNRPWRQSGRR